MSQRMQINFAFSLMAILVGVAGCGDGGYASSPSTAEVAESAPNKNASEPVVDATDAEIQSTAASQVEPPSQAEPASASPAVGQPQSEPAAAPATERVVAETGVGEKGRTLKSGMMTSSVKAFFRTKERLVFIQVQHAMNLYDASNGSPAKSHDEFMEKVIKANGIKLPELPRGAKYVYDPKKAELMVERPAR